MSSKWKLTQDAFGMNVAFQVTKWSANSERTNERKSLQARDAFWALGKTESRLVSFLSVERVKFGVWVVFVRQGSVLLHELRIHLHTLLCQLHTAFAVKWTWNAAFWTESTVASHWDSTAQRNYIEMRFRDTKFSKQQQQHFDQNGAFRISLKERLFR